MNKSLCLVLLILILIVLTLINCFYYQRHKLLVPVVTLSIKGNQKLSKILSKGFERSVYWNEYETKRKIKNRTNEHSIFSNKTFQELTGCLFWFIQTTITKIKGIIQNKNYLPKNIVNNNVIINGKQLLYQPVGSDTKLYEKNEKVSNETR